MQQNYQHLYGGSYQNILPTAERVHVRKRQAQVIFPKIIPQGCSKTWIRLGIFQLLGLCHFFYTSLPWWKKKKKRKSPSKIKSFPEVTASRIKPEKQEEGLHLVRKKRLLGKKTKETLWNVTPSHWICFSRWKPVFQDTIFINMFYLSCLYH